MKKNLLSRIVAGVGALALIATMVPGLAMPAKATADDITALEVADGGRATVTVTSGAIATTDYAAGATDLTFTMAPTSGWTFTEQKPTITARMATETGTANDPIPVKKSGNTYADDLEYSMAGSDLGTAAAACGASGSNKATITLTVTGAVRKYTAPSASVANPKDTATVKIDGTDTQVNVIQVGKGEGANVEDIPAGSDLVLAIPVGTTMGDDFEITYKQAKATGETETKTVPEADIDKENLRFTIKNIQGDISDIVMGDAADGLQLIIAGATDPTVDGDKVVADVVIDKRFAPDTVVTLGAKEKLNSGRTFAKWVITNDADAAEFDNSSSATELGAKVKLIKEPADGNPIKITAYYGYVLKLPTEQHVKYYVNYGLSTQKEVTEIAIPVDAAAGNVTVTAVPDDGYAFADTAAIWAGGNADGYGIFKGGDAVAADLLCDATSAANATNASAIDFVFVPSTIQQDTEAKLVTTLDEGHIVYFQDVDGVTYSEDQFGRKTYTSPYTYKIMDNGAALNFYVILDSTKVMFDESAFKVTYKVGKEGEETRLNSTSANGNEDKPENQVFAITKTIFDQDKDKEGIYITVYGVKNVDGTDTLHFKDEVAGKWYVPAVEWAAAQGISNGIDNVPNFGIGQTLKRGEAVTFIANYAKAAVTDVTEKPFPDVELERFYAKTVAWAVKEDIVVGFPDGEFKPEDSVTRAQAATMIHRYADPEGTGTKTFPDVTAAWQIPHVSWAGTKGVVNGRTDGTFDPETNCTREEFVQMLYNLENSK